RASNALKGYDLTGTGSARETQIVPTVTLDWLMGQLPRPDVIKIDVEGAELEVLRGGRLMLLEMKPIVICEVAKGSRDEVSHLFREIAYTMYPGLKPRKEWEPIGLASWNTVAMPNSPRHV